MTRHQQIKEWVKKYKLGYLFNPGGVEFIAGNGIPNCHCSEFVDGEPGEFYSDDKSFERLKKWVEEIE